MKKIILVLLVCSIQVFSQNYCPLNIGNEYLYLVSGAELSHVKISNCSTYNNILYYNFNGMPIRYDSLQKKLYVYCFDEDTLWVDFNAVGIHFIPGCLQMNFGSSYTSMQKSICGEYLTLKGYSYDCYGPGLHLWAPGIGFAYSEWSYTLHYTQYTNNVLIEAIINDNGNIIHKSANYKPAITVGENRIADDSLHFYVNVEHPYNNVPGKFSFISGVKLAGYYEKGSSRINIDTLIFSYPGIDPRVFKIDVPLDTSLLNDGYLFYYKAIAKDKGLIPVYASYPDSGYCNINATSVGKEMQSIATYSLSQNYPNPFNPSTTIKYTIPSESNVNITVYNSLGSMVKELVKERKGTGDYELKFDGAGLASGVYFITLKAASADGKNSFIQTKKMILMK